MARSKEEILSLYENLRKKQGTAEDLTLKNGEAYTVLNGTYAALPKELGRSFNKYRKALITLYTVRADGREDNKEKLVDALTTLDDFGEFLNGETDGKTNYQVMLERGKALSFKKEQLDRTIKRMSDAAGLAIDLPVLPEAEPQQKKQQPEARPVAGEPEPVRPSRSRPAVKEPEPAPQPAAPGHLTRSAAQWIEGWKQDLEREKQRQDYPAAYYAKLMAARMLADSKRGSAKRLRNTQLTEEQINDKARELMTNGHFQQFISSLAGSGQKLAKAEAAVGTGHCGDLDDMFKSFLKKLPAGKLKNEQLLDRYMPTARDRIEELQRQTEGKQLRGIASCTDEAAEITVLRNLAKAERYKKGSLEKKIPTKAESTLDVQTKTLAESSLYANGLGANGDRDLRDLVLEGHGGALVDELRLRDKVSPQRSEPVTEILQENTVGGRLKTIRKDAEELQERLEEAGFEYDEDSPEMKKLVQESKGLMAEYLSLDMLSRDPNTKQIDPRRMEANVPWRKIESVKEDPDKVPVVRALTAGLDPDNIDVGLRRMAESTHEEFIDAIQDQYHKSKPAKQRQKEEQEIFKKVGKAFAQEEKEPLRRRNSIAGGWAPEEEEPEAEPEVNVEEGPQIPMP